MPFSIQLRKAKLWWIVGLGRVARKSIVVDLVILIALNVVLGFRYLASSSDKVPGFPFRMDAYGYALVANIFVDLIHQNIIPLGNVWVPQVSAGYTYFLVPDPLYIAYTSITWATGDFVVTYKILLFSLYVLGGLSCYYLASILLNDRGARLLSAVTYTFSQTTLYQVSLGHLNTAYGMALMPATLGLVLKGYRDSKIGSSILAGFLLFFLTIEREDYAYMIFTTVLLLMLYHLLFRRENRKSIIVNTFAVLSVALVFSFPYLQSTIFSKLSLWDQVGTAYAASSPTLIQLFVPIFSNVEAYLGDFTLLLAIVTGYALFRRVHPASFIYENNLYAALGLMAAFCVVLGVGSLSPLYGVLYSYLPSFTGFRAVAGNPTYWLQPAKVWLSILAGAGGGLIAEHQFSWSHLPFRIPKVYVIAVLLLLLVIDGSTFLARNEPYSPIPGWQATAPGIWHYDVYQFLQTASVPEGASAYKYIARDRGNYSVLEIPDLYTLPDYQYLTYLRGTDVNMLNPYGVPSVAPIFSEIYSSDIGVSASLGNASALASDLALVGVKYLVYEGSWGGPYFPQGLKEPSSPFEFVMQDGNVSLFRNLLYGSNYQLSNLLMDAGFETPNDTIWQPWNTSDIGQCVSACFDYSTGFGGIGSLREVSPNLTSVTGRNQFINASSLSAGKYIVSGWSKAVNVSSGAEYGLRVVEIYQNGTEQTVAYAPFQPGTHDWQYSQSFFDFEPNNSLKQLAVSTYIRSATGEAWIDDVNLQNQVAISTWSGVFAARSLYNKTSETIAQQNIVEINSTSNKVDPLHLEVDAQLAEPAYLIFPMSYDQGWSVTSAYSRQDLRLTQYDGLMTIHLTGGSYKLLFFYDSHQFSLNETLVIYSLAVFAVVAVVLGNLVIQSRRRLSRLIEEGRTRKTGVPAS